MQTVHEKYLIKRLHTMLSMLGIDKEAKRDMLMANFGVSSTLELTSHQLVSLCDRLEMEIFPQKKEMDSARKRLIAAIGGWLKAMGKRESAHDIHYIKAIACRACEAKTFNKISLDRLRSLYAAFLKKQKDLKSTEMLTTEELDVMQYLN